MRESGSGAWVLPASCCPAGPGSRARGGGQRFGPRCSGGKGTTPGGCPGPARSALGSVSPVSAAEPGGTRSAAAAGAGATLTCSGRCGRDPPPPPLPPRCSPGAVSASRQEPRARRSQPSCPQPTSPAPAEPRAQQDATGKGGGVCVCPSQCPSLLSQQHPGFPPISLSPTLSQPFGAELAFSERERCLLRAGGADFNITRSFSTNIGFEFQIWAEQANYQKPTKLM